MQSLQKLGDRERVYKEILYSHFAYARVLIICSDRSKEV